MAPNTGWVFCLQDECKNSFTCVPAERVRGALCAFVTEICINSNQLLSELDTGSISYEGRKKERAAQFGVDPDFSLFESNVFPSITRAHMRERLGRS